MPHPSQNPPASALEVLDLIPRLCPPLPAERVSLAEALGRTLREAAPAPEDQPPMDRSAVDGFAIRIEDGAARYRVVDQIRAGGWKPRQLQAGEAVKIATGGALPGDGLQVVMREDTQEEAGCVVILRRETERHIRFRGEDARAGQVLLEPGTVLEPGTLALLASLGCTQPLVARRPRVAHVVTGNEIVPPEQTPAPGQIRDTNSTLVRAFCNQAGIEPVQQRVPEDEAETRRVVGALAADADLLLISGGASVGEHDFTRRVLEALAFTLHVHKTTARPGKPLIVASRNGTVAFGLPGNPLAHFVCLSLYVRAALHAWAGLPARPPFHTGTLAADLDNDGNARETFWPARWTVSKGAAMLSPLRWSSSGDLTSLATANALIRVTAGVDRWLQGQRVEFVRTGTDS